MTKRGKIHPEHDLKPAEPASAAEIEAARRLEQVAAQRPDSPIGPVAGDKRNVFIGTLNLMMGPMREWLDPVKKVCYVPLQPFQEHWEKKYKKPHGRRAHWVLILDLTLLFIIGALTVGGIFAWFVLPIFPQPRLVNLEVLSPRQTIVSGAPTAIIIAYRNETGQPLTNAQLQLRLPESFVAAKPAPSGGEESAAETARPDATLPSGTRTFVVGEVKPQGRGEIRLDGAFFAPVGSKPVLTSEFSFWEEGATSPTRVSTFNEWLIEDTVLQLSFRFEDEIIRGRQNAVTISYVNQSKEKIDQAVIRLLPPDDFVITGAQPAMGSRYEWVLNDLEPDARGAVTAYGFLRAGAGRQAVPNFLVQGYVVQDGARQLAQEIRQNIDALTTGFEISQEIAEPAGRQALIPGETLAVVIRYRNGGQKAIQNVSLQLTTAERYLNQPGALAWDASSMPELARLEPNQAGTVTTRLKLKDDIDATLLGTDRHPTFTVTARARYFLTDDLTRPIYADTAELSLPIATRLKVEASALYWTKDGEQLGVGPVPPRVGETTKYWVTIHVVNSTNAVRDGRLEAFLAPGLEWTGRFSVTAGQPIAYLPVTGQVIWEIGNLPEYADGGGTRLGASFEVALTPTAAAVGQVPALLKDIKISGLDSMTGTKVQAATADVNANLPFGPAGRMSGAVVK